MLEKPALLDEKIIAHVRDNYGLSPTGIEFLPLGNDSSAWVYRLWTEPRKTYFLKVKKGPVSEPSVAVPRYLSDEGLAQVVAPLPTQTQELWKGLDDFALILYPFIAGKTGMEGGLSDGQWTEFGAVLKQIHSTQLPAWLSGSVPQETFKPKWSSVVKELQAKITANDYDTVHEKELAAFWNERRAVIRQIVERAEILGRWLQNQCLDYRLCHSDIHTANVLLDQDAQLFIVDWDQPLFAPKERDLLFIVGGAVGGGNRPIKEEALFFQGYGPAEIDPVALAYYRYEWVVQEIGDYGERVFLTNDLGEATRAEAVQGFCKLFHLGDVVEAAYSSEDNLPSELKVARR